MLLSATVFFVRDIMNRRLTLFLVFVTLGLASWTYYLYQSDDSSLLSSLIKKDGEPDYTGNRMETTIYDNNGKPQYFASALKIKRFENNARTEFIQPLVELFSKETAEKQWRLTADSAEITQDKMLYLRGNVKLVSLDKTSSLQRIETDNLDIDLTSQDIFSENVVKSTGLGFSSSGTGITGNLKKQVATLTKDVKTYIEPVVIQQNQELNKDKTQ